VDLSVLSFSFEVRKMENRKAICDNCGERMNLSIACGAWVCPECDHHKGLVRCFCGWAADGGDGRKQIEELGEVID
jgi:hypothetical protein